MPRMVYDSVFSRRKDPSTGIPFNMIFCSNCGAQVIEKIPAGDSRPRHICESCNTIHYQNPKIVAGCLPAWEGRLLLCKRAIEPRHGLWTLPAGFMENGESTEQAAMRETLEEACADVVDLSLYGVFSIPQINRHPKRKA